METKHAPQIARLRGKLDQLLEFCRRLASFAQQNHVVPPGTPLPEPEIEQFESRHGIRLPEDYREFVAGIGHGCPGPCRGILRLDRWAETAPWSAGQVPDGYLARPCPLRLDLARDERWQEALGCPAQDRYQGAIALAHQGEGRYCVLIVSGPCRGRVVYVDLGPTPPRFAQQVKFLDWYEDWLDETLESAQYEAQSSRSFPP